MAGKIIKRDSNSNVILSNTAFPKKSTDNLFDECDETFVWYTTSGGLGRGVKYWVSDSFSMTYEHFAAYLKQKKICSYWQN